MANSFLRRVRIHGGEFGASARAMHRNAELGKVPNSTIERKQMSTTIKRVALVAVAALGFGVLSTVPSSAVINNDSLALSSPTAAQTTAETYTATSAVATLSFLPVNSTNDSISVTAALVSGPATTTALPYLRLVETSSAVIDGASPAAGTKVDPNTETVVRAGAQNVATVAKYAVYLGTSATAAPTVAGTYVVRITPKAQGSGALLGATAQTLTITVTTAPTLDTVANSATIIINKGETSSATADVAVTHPKGTSASLTSSRAAAATIKVSLLNAAGSATTSESYTAVITGPGVLGSGANTGATISGIDPAGRAISVKAGDLVQVFNDGTAGAATVTISSAAGKVLGTKTVTFYGDAATITTKVVKSVIGPSLTTGTLLAVVKDAAGVEIQDASLNLVSSDTTKISGAYTATGASYSATDGGYLIDVTGVAAGTANLTITTKSSATATTGVDAAAVSVRVGSQTPASVAVTLDKSTYLPGEKATVTISLKDSSGLDLADGIYTGIFATGGISTSYVLGTGSDTMTDTVVRGYASGKKTYTVYMPIVSGGTVDFTWTTGSVAAAVGGGLATANQAVAGKVSATLTNAAVDAATDAANEATDAANAATDAANAAAEAADAATAAAQDAADAVAALSTQVNELISALRKQITSLTAIVLKIQKKVKA